MKKNLIAGIALVLLGTFAAIPAYAASFLINPEPVTASQGEQVSLIIPFNPGDDVIYTAQIEIAYPNHILRGDSFILNPASGVEMRILSARPFTEIDQNRGVMRYTIGFPGGLDETIVLGTANFTAIANGSGVVTVSPSSQALDRDGNNVAEPFLLAKTVAVGNASSQTTGTLAIPFTTVVTPPQNLFAGGGESAIQSGGTSGASGQSTTAVSTTTSTTTAGLTDGTDAADEANLRASVAEATEGGGSARTILFALLIILVVASIASALFGLFRRA